MARVDIARLQEIAEVEFADIVSDAFIVDINTLRVLLTDGSFIDVWFSLKLSSRYSFHWERRAIDGRSLPPRQCATYALAIRDDLPSPWP